MNDERILELLKKEDSKQNILTKLTQTNDPKIIQEIIKLFDDDDIAIRGEVFSTLFLNKNNILEPLIYGLKNENFINVNSNKRSRNYTRNDKII